MPCLRRHPLGDPSYYLREAAEKSCYPAYSTLRKYIREGRLPAEKDARGWVRVRKADLDALSTPVGGSSFDCVEAAIERIIDAAPPLTDEQREELAAIVSRSRS